jgi:hypothetical protein
LQPISWKVVDFVRPSFEVLAPFANVCGSVTPVPTPTVPLMQVGIVDVVV